ncbi:DM13 domain-containing protein [Candidatus Poriferisodalis sp.]|uniref:DM13 domain-containing protein n=1 Tax=Candidatus Poriferisodalis sp. TaxID=3101277 RepID=UPI003B02445B
MKRLLGKLIPRTTGGRWAAAAVLGLASAAVLYLAFSVFAVHKLFVDDVVDEEAPEFAVDLGETDIDELISAALAGGDSEGRAALAERRTELESEADRMREDAMADGSDEAMGHMYGHLNPMLEEIAQLEAAEEQMMSPDEAAQLAAEREREQAETMAAAEEMAEGGVRVAYVGSFGPRTHPAEGTAVVLTDGTQTFLRFDDDFATDNGPDLNVYLHTAGPDASVGDLVDDFIDLGDLKGNIGAQNYVIPDDVDLDRYSTVSVWCVRFRVVFGTAELAPMN